MDEKRTSKVLLMVLAVFTKLWECAAITNNGQRNFRHIPASSASDQLLEWELGLREAVTQVLQRHYYAPDLRLRVLSAPMMHRQKAATPFGDISTLAKGRLYATAGGGFEFVQEYDDRDCGPCPRCNRVVCEDIYSEDSTHLLALWTVKRLRHRTHHGGFNYETEYTVSPVDDVTEAIRDGRFDYSLPGHVLVIKQKEAHGSTFPETYNKKIPTDLFKPDVVIGIDNYGNRHVLKTYHPFFTSPTQQQPVTTPPENQEIELYKILLKTLASKTSTTPSQEGPFRVSLNHYIPPPLPSSPTSPGAETKPPKQPDNVGDVTQPVKTTVHYFMPVGEVLMTTTKMEGSTTKTAVTEKSKTTKKPSMLTPKTKIPMIATPKRPTIGLIPEEESEEESVKLFPGPEEVGGKTTKPAPMAVTEVTKTTKKPSLLKPKTKTPGLATPKKPTIGLVPEEESEEELEELFPEPEESGSSRTNNITKPSTQKTSSTAKIPTTKFLIQAESEEGSDEELFAEPVETTKVTAAPTKKLTTQAATKQTTKRHKSTTTRGTTMHGVSSIDIASTKLGSSTSLGTTSAMTPGTTPSMTSIESSTAIVAPSKATPTTRPTFPKTTKTYRKRPSYISTITKVRKPITTKSTTLKTTAQISTAKTQTSPRPTMPKPTVQSTTEAKTLSSTAVLPEPSTEATTVQTIATSKPTTAQTIPIILATSTVQVPTTSYPTQPYPMKTSQVQIASETFPEMVPTLPMTATTQNVDVTVLNQMQVPTEVGTTSPYQITTQSSATMLSTEVTSETNNQTTIESNEATKSRTTVHSTTEMARETTKIETTPQMTEMTTSTRIPSTTETIYTQRPSSLATTTILSSTEAEKATSALKKTIPTVKTTEANTEEVTTGLLEMLTQLSTLATTPVRTTVTKITAATEAIETTTTMEKVTVTPIYIEMTTPSIMSTETSTTPTLFTVKQTTADTFLVDRQSTKPTRKRPTGEVDEDDIFGVPLPTSTTTTRPAIKSVPKGFDDLFDDLEEAHNAKIIFSDFYEASTSPTPTKSTTEMKQLLTSQSYETSISFKVNKRDRPQFQPSTANPRSDTLQTPEQVLHHQTLQLVNHARSIEYLNEDGSDKTLRSPKYKRRRGYVSRTKKLVSKRRRISRDRSANSQNT